jgi:hypothetical protein
MTHRVPTLLVLSALLVAPSLASAATVPTSTDEARALAGGIPPQAAFAPAALAGAIPTSTDAARALTGRTAAPEVAQPAPAIRVVASTDEARAVAGGLIALAAAARSSAPAMLAGCGKACDCRHP